MIRAPSVALRVGSPGAVGWRDLALPLLLVLAAALLIAVADGLAHAAVAQSPFGGARPDAVEPPGGLVGWLIEMQSRFYRQISTTLRAAKEDGNAVWTLLAISFAYGIFHAAGPGHGKAVISSYMIASEDTARRGIVLSFVAALLQSLVAIAIVSIGAWLLNATARTLCGTQRTIEIASYALIAVFGARLVWTKGRGLVRAVRSAAVASIPSPTLAPALLPMAEAVPQPVSHHVGGHAAPHAHHDRDHPRHLHAHVHADDEPGHVHDEHCGHSHGPTPDQLAGPGGWRRGFGAIIAVGLRPCSGAILVLVFALAQGLFWAGIAATLLMGLGTGITVACIAILAVSAKGVARRLVAHREGMGVVALRALEFGAAAAVLLFGAGLLAGYIAAERVACL